MNDNLSPQQFGKYRIRYKGVGKPNQPGAGMHHVEARLSGKYVGRMRWKAEDDDAASRRHKVDPGEITDITVNSEHRRKGVATAMYNYAVASGIKPAPEHSGARSIAGDAWAATTSGYLTPLRDD